MKKILLFLVVIVTSFTTPLFSQTADEPEALGLPGDNLNLYAVLEVFQNSKTIEEFEKSINDKETNVNNLDLDNDKNIDYIEVTTEKEGDSHLIILQVAINKTEKQDIAVIEVSKGINNKVNVQIIGDENLYGKNYIIEPSDSSTVSGTPNPGYKESSTVVINNNTTNNNYATTTTNNNVGSSTSVSAWPVVLFLFSPIYVVYHSPWYWGYYPPYWHPWTPIFYHSYWGYHSHYYRNNYYYRPSYNRHPRRYDGYYNRRNSSRTVIKTRDRGGYKGVYDGKVYKRPATPSSKPNNSRPTRPTMRPSERPTSPVTRPNRPSTRPTAPTTRPAMPSTRPSTRPSNRAKMPSTRHTSTSTRPSSGNKMRRD